MLNRDLPQILYNPPMNWKDINWNKALKWGAIGGGGVVVASQLGKIIRGLILGVIFIIIAFGLTWASVRSIQENSKTVDGLELHNVDEVENPNNIGDLVKVSGKIEPSVTVATSLSTCGNAECTVESEEKTNYSNLLYYEIRYEQLQVVEKKETTSNSNGESTTEVTYEESWEKLDNKKQTQWAELQIGSYALQPEEAKIVIDKEETTINSVYLTNTPTVQTFGQNVSDTVGDVRAQVRYIPADDRDYIVVGELNSTSINKGDSYIISDKSDAELVSTLKTEENAQRWGLRLAAWILLTIGITSMLSPVLVFTDLIPIIGKSARGLATFVSSIISGVIVLLTVVLINYWWVFFIIFAIGIAIAIKVLLEGKDKNTNLDRLQKE